MASTHKRIERIEQALGQGEVQFRVFINWAEDDDMVLDEGVLYTKAEYKRLHPDTIFVGWDEGDDEPDITESESA